MSKIAIIPARGGSKRIPSKNIKDFLGKPIIAYSIEAALESELFDEIMVSTDSEEIAEVSKGYGAKVPFLRNAKNANDFATLNEVLAEVIEEYKIIGCSFDLGCCILATAPFISTVNLNKSLHLMLTKGFDSVRPIVKFSYPIQRAFKNQDGSLQFMFENFQQKRSQDLEEAYHDAGQFYWFKTETLLTSSNRGGFVISEFEAHDIDTLEDWKLAEMKYLLINT